MYPEEFEEAATADQLAICNFSASMTTNYTEFVEDDVYDPDDMGDPGSGGLGWMADNCDRLLVFEHNPYIEFVNGYLSPIVVLLTIFNNSLTCAVLLQHNMRTPTNVFLIALAISDALTGIFPLPAFVRFYATGSYRSWLVPTAWCHTYPATTVHLPTIWHTTSIWLTVALAIQRYIYVRYPARAKRLCTVSNAVRAVIAVYAAAVLSQLTCFFHYEYTTIEVAVPGEPEPVAACSFHIAQFLAERNDTYFGLYWYVIFAINLSLTDFRGLFFTCILLRPQHRVLWAKQWAASDIIIT
jgi:hypothetical protein